MNIISLFGGRKSLPTPLVLPGFPPRPLCSVSCFLRVLELVGHLGYRSSSRFERRERAGTRAGGPECTCQVRGGVEGHSEQASPKNLKLALGTGMLGLRGTAAVKRNHETRKGNAPLPTPTTCLARPLPLPSGSPQLLTPPGSLWPSPPDWSVEAPSLPGRHFPPW